MKRIFAATIFLALVAAAAHAQDTNRSTGQGYFFAAPGGAQGTPSLHIGAGGEALLYKGLGFGAEIGYFTPFEDFGAGFGIASVNGAYHFVQSGKKVVPFVTGGYSLAFREGVGNLFNVGGGVNYWMREGLGLRVEFRDHIFNARRNAEHFWGVRVGLSFR
jgi:hypothetical protein